MAQNEFEVGLVMAGAISAGAYTGGVVDFLIEALEAWEAAKEAAGRGGAAVPDHRVRIRAISGASAGAMTAAMLVRGLASQVTAVGDISQPPDAPVPAPENQVVPFRNPFYAAWVQSIDIRHLLASKDLADGRAKVVSLLDSSALPIIGRNVMAVGGNFRANPPNYLSEVVDVFLTTTNLRGVPYGFNLAGPLAYNYMMATHADYSHFALSWSPPSAEGGVWLDPGQLGSDGNWAKMMESAIASGAFPVGLAPRLLQRPVSDYASREWRVDGPCLLETVPNAPGEAPRPVSGDLAGQQATVCGHPPHAVRGTCGTRSAIAPIWPPEIAQAPDSVYRYWNVDGGTMNNEPLELARHALSRGGRNERNGGLADRAVIMVDPFPNGSDADDAYDEDIDLIKVVKSLLGALIEQARFKPEELFLAADPNVFSRFVISPIYQEGQQPPATPAIASAILGGFGGFLSEAFRSHDFQLGRRNCQRFLQKHFVLEANNPLFDSWRSNGSLLAAQTFIDGQGRAVIPIIPLVGALATPIPLPVRPRPALVDLDALRDMICDRLDGIVPRLLDGIPNTILKGALKLIWSAGRWVGLRGKAADMILDKIKSELNRLK